MIVGHATRRRLKNGLVGFVGVLASAVHGGTVPSAAHAQADAVQAAPAVPAETEPPQNATVEASGAPAQVTGWIPRLRGITWDVQLEGGIGLQLADDVVFIGFGRLRGGLLWLLEPWLLFAGVTGEVGRLANYGVGAQLEVAHTENGMSGQLGMTYADGARGIFHASVGYALLNLEWQHDFGGRYASNALFLKLRVPIGALAALLSR